MKDNVNKPDILDSKQILVALNIQLASSAIESVLASVLKPFNLTSQQYNVLKVLARAYPNPGTIKSLSSNMIDKNSNVSRLVDKLEKKRWVERRESEDDKRKVIVHITDLGNDVVKNADIQVEKVISEKINLFKPEEIQLLNELLKKVHC